MGKFARRDDGTWCWHLMGKGQKEDYLLITDELMDSLREYRTFHGMPPLPSPGKSTPLVMRLEGPVAGAKPMSDNMIYRIVKDMFTAASRDAESEVLSEISAGLRRVSTHWQRHTSLTHQLDAGIPLATVRRNARHASIATTSKYLWSEDRVRHEQTSAKLGLAEPSRSLARRRVKSPRRSSRCSGPAPARLARPKAPWHTRSRRGIAPSGSRLPCRA